MEKLTDEENRAIKALLSAKRRSLPVPASFVCPRSLIDRGLVSLDSDGVPSISDDQEWQLLAMGVHPSG
jgi:hypothetical protein